MHSLNSKGPPITELETNTALAKTGVECSQGRCWGAAYSPAQAAKQPWPPTTWATECEYVWIAVIQWWVCALSNALHSSTKWKYSSRGLQLYIFIYIHYSLFSQDCIIQVNKVILLPVSLLLSHGNEFDSRLLLLPVNILPKDTKFMSPPARSSPASPVLFTGSLFWVLNTWQCWYPLVSEVIAALIFCREVRIHLLPSCLFSADLLHPLTPGSDFKELQQSVLSTGTAEVFGHKTKRWLGVKKNAPAGGILFKHLF